MKICSKCGDSKEDCDFYLYANKKSMPHCKECHKNLVYTHPKRKEYLRDFSNRRRDKNPGYASWYSMIGRCYNEKLIEYKYYGAKGIKVCDRWLGKSRAGQSFDGFEKFIEDMGPKPKGFVIDRIDSDGNYEPDNCRWISRSYNTWRAMMRRWHGGDHEK